MAWLELLTAAAVALAADQLSKRQVLAEPRFALATATRRYVSIRCIINRRAAAISLSEIGIVAAWILCAALTLFALEQEPLAANPLAVAGIGLALGGVSGNVIDLLWRGGIVDFIALGSWTIFNLADAAIVSGLALTVLALI
jgi:signal peptidase II